MKIGLVRHFKVKRGYPEKSVSTDELMKWVEDYDASEVVENEVDLCGVEWQQCYASDLTRAVKTAEKTYSGSVIYLEELREISIAPLFHSKFKFPYFLHMGLIRGAWWLNHRSQPESKQEILERVKTVVDQVVKTNQDTLIVGHGGIMIFMRKELIRRGFRGPSYRSPLNGWVYVFERGGLMK
ncbi:histidine phosphatase family protein [Bacillus sp. 2205SS5-2]|uniref:histidine phosphatase family protein n=1 Tax=Bacillus sp. 2205SS5-2 TaxID=3109031 RepID=UPI003004E89A